LKEKADERIIFLGFVHGKDFETIRNGARVYIHPSLFDGTSISLLGALGAGKAVISSDLKENQDVGGDAAIYFEKENSNDLREKLQQLLDAPDRISELGRKSTQRARELYDWNKVTDSYERLYWPIRAGNERNRGH